MKKALLIIGIILLAAAGICIGLSIWFHHSAHSFMDGTASLYARLMRQFRTFLFVGLGLSVSGAAALVASILMKAK